jgi:sugar transferase (PEP-CTERM/EpsH1 system associated)
MRVLFLTHRLPYAPNRGDRIRAYHMLRTLAGQAEVTLVSLVHDDEEERHAKDLLSVVAHVEIVRVHRARNLVRGAAMLATELPLTHALLDAPALPRALEKAMAGHRPDVVLAYCSGIAHAALNAPLAHVPLVLDLVDVDSEKWALYARTTRGPMRWIYEREARCLGRFEEEIARRARSVLVVNERERASLAARVPDAHILSVGNGIDVSSFWPDAPPAAAPRVVFCGVFNYRPNERGALWFANEVWPTIRKLRPDAVLSLVGAHPTAQVLKLARRDPSIEVTGAVPDVRPWLWRSAVAVAPLAEARGLQNKVLEALAAGLPTITTRIVAEGLPDAVLPGCRRADDPLEFAHAVVRCLAMRPEERRDVAMRADLSGLRWEDQLRPFRDVIAAAARGSSVAPPAAAPVESSKGRQESQKPAHHTFRVLRPEQRLGIR